MTTLSRLGSGPTGRGAGAPPRRRPTMNDVARLAGVSLKTVSRVVNREDHVRGETTSVVMDAVRELGYQRNDLARNLRQGQSTASIALIIEDVSDPFYSHVARAVEEVASRHRCMVLVANSGEDPHREEELVGEFGRRRIDGMVIVPISDDHEFLRTGPDLGVPIVFADRPARGFEADVVLTGNRQGARRGVEHLITHGHRQIGFVGNGETVYTAAERLRGYRSALQSAGIPVDAELVRAGPRDVADAYRATVDLLSLPQPPTAIFGANNRMSVGAVRAMHETGRRVALVGFDDFELADCLDPPVTVVAQDPHRLGDVAAEMLFRRLAGDGGPPRTVRLPVQMIVRGSGEARP